MSVSVLPASPVTEEEWEKLAERVLDRKGSTTDALLLAHHYKTIYKPTLANLTATQSRCTELLEEVRTLRGSRTA